LINDLFGCLRHLRLQQGDVCVRVRDITRLSVSVCAAAINVTVSLTHYNASSLHPTTMMKLLLPLVMVTAFPLLSTGKLCSDYPVVSSSSFFLYGRPA